MYEREREKLNAVIHKENEVRRVLNAQVPKLLKILKPFVGDKIRKANGELVKKLTDQLGFLRESSAFKIKPTAGQKYAAVQNMYLTSTDYSARLEVSISFSNGDHTRCYAKGTAYLVDIAGGIATRLYDWETLKMLSAAKEWHKYQRAYKAKEAADRAIDTMWYGLREWVR